MQPSFGRCQKPASLLVIRCHSQGW